MNLSQMHPMAIGIKISAHLRYAARASFPKHFFSEANMQKGRSFKTIGFYFLNPHLAALV
ncbi:MAG TPA: hypothetical protein VLH56_15420 [Dissulfurispiraceae bacterium]|nr:hypothetical protein [Dissulfurispiraceae bacterium]